MASLEPPRLIQRYERPRPGELVHLDIRKLGRIGRVGHRIHGDRRTRVAGIGWEYLHVAIEDHSRLTYAEILPDELGDTTAAFLVRAVAWLAAHGIVVERLLNGPMRGPTAAPTGEREPSMTTYSSTTFADHTAR